MRTTGCHCPRTLRNWNESGDCISCGARVLETQIMDAVKAVLVQDPQCLLWRNEIGHNTHFPDGRKRKAPIKYGIANPGGADLIGCYGNRLLAVETKTPRGAQTAAQVSFARHVRMRRNIYALVRSESAARALLQWLQDGCQAEQPKETR